MTDIPTSKICTGCKEEKALEDYPRRAKGKYGRASQCKACKKLENQRTYEKYGDDIRANYVGKYHSDIEKSRAYERVKYLRRKQRNDQ